MHKLVESAACYVMMSVRVSAWFGNNALALLVVVLVRTHDTLDQVLQRIGHTPQPRVALSELCLTELTELTEPHGARLAAPTQYY